MASKHQKRFLWIDDAPNERKAQIAFLSRKIHIEKLIIGPEEKSSWFDRLKSRRIPAIEIVFVDQNLSNNSTYEAFSAGSSLCSVLRAKFPGVPIVGVSATSKKEIPYSQVKEFTEFYELAQMRDSIAEIETLISGFSKLRCSKNQKMNAHIMDLLGVPESDQDLMEKIIPSDFKGKASAQVVEDLYKWLKSSLFSFQGILISPPQLAAVIGLTVEAFRRYVESELEECKYKGVFACDDTKLYWKSLALEKLTKLASGEKTGLKLSHYGYAITKNEKTLAECPVCHEKYTEVLAYEEDSFNSIEKSAAHLRCVQEAHISRPAFFDPVYVVRNAVI